MRIYFFLFLILNTCFSFSQTYHPFPEDSTVKWHMHYEYWDNPVCHEKFVFDYVMRGDTNISNRLYKKVYIENLTLVQTLQGQFHCSYPPENSYAAAFRQDTMSRKAFLVMPGQSNDTLLYDFMLHAGDTLNSVTLPIPWMAGCPDTLNIITVIDSILLNNEYNIVQAFNCVYYIVEQFGSSADPFGAVYSHPGIDNHLICVRNDTSILFDTQFSSPMCNLHVNLIEVNPNDNIKLFPNPTRDYLNIISEINILSVKLFSIDGREIFCRNNFELSLSIDMENLNCGIYYLIIYSNEFTYSRLVSKI